MLTAKLSHKHLQHLEIAKLLMANGADPKVKDADGWSCLDEAVSQVCSLLNMNSIQLGRCNAGCSFARPIN
jgi:hypothetical protein